MSKKKREKGNVLRISTSPPRLPNAVQCPYCLAGPLSGVTGVDFGTEEEVYKETGGKRQPNKPPPPMLPKPGSPTICTYCGGLLVFNEQLQQVKPSPSQIEEFKRDEELWDFLTALSETCKRLRPRS